MVHDFRPAMEVFESAFSRNTFIVSEQTDKVYFKMSTAR